MLRFSTLRSPVAEDEETTQDVLERQWHSMRYWRGGKDVETGFELANGSVYVGDLTPAGMPEGSGRLTSGDQAWEYSGEFRAAAPAGVGTLQVAGTHAEGLFDGDRLVEGTCALPSGVVYNGHPNAEGEWTCEASTRKSKIQVQYPGGEVYEGDLRSGVPHGVGTRTAASGRRYRGQFQHGLRHGAGRMVLASGENLQGHFLGRGNLAGEGTIALQGGGEMTGTFLRGKLHGEGLYRASNGVECKGSFHDSVLSGHATITCPAEARAGKEIFPAAEYEGAVENDRAHGEGEVVMGALQYEGTWVDGQLQGQGTLRELQVCTCCALCAHTHAHTQPHTCAARSRMRTNRYTHLRWHSHARTRDGIHTAWTCGQDQTPSPSTCVLS